MKSSVGVESAQVIDTLGVADTLRDDPRSLESETAWMAISTSHKTYPDETVLKYARWAQEHTGAFTLVVSDWVQLYNWAAGHEVSAGSNIGINFTDPAQSGGGISWETFFTGKHVKELDRSARRRAEQIEALFEAHGVDGGVTLWKEVLGKVVEESQETDVAGAEFLNQEHGRLTWTIAQNPATQLAISAIQRQLAPDLVDRLAAKGRPAAEVHEIMQGYSIEEIFMTVLQAKTGWGTIKIGPEWERLYDQISSAYMGVAHGPDEPAPAFGAVYLK